MSLETFKDDVCKYLKHPELTEFELNHEHINQLMFYFDSTTGYGHDAPPAWLALITGNYNLFQYLVQNGADLYLKRNMDMVIFDCTGYNNCMSILLRNPSLLQSVYQMGVLPTVEDLKMVLSCVHPSDPDVLEIMLSYGEGTLVNHMMKYTYQTHTDFSINKFMLRPLERVQLDYEFGLGHGLPMVKENREKVMEILLHYGAVSNAENLCAIIDWSAYWSES